MAPGAFQHATDSTRRIPLRPGRLENRCINFASRLARMSFSQATAFGRVTKNLDPNRRTAIRRAASRDDLLIPDLEKQLGSPIRLAA
jgi:hypothetical protein